MTVALLIGLWLHNELSFNKYHKNYDKIAQVLQNQTFNGEVETWWSQAMQLGPELKNSYGSNFKYVVMSSWNRDYILSYGEKRLSQKGNYMDIDAPEMLGLEMIGGTRKGLSDINSILISRSVAKAFFGDEDPINKILKLDEKTDVKVTGVYEDIPLNSSFSNLAFIAPWQLLVKTDNLEKRVGWGNSWFQTIVQIADNADMDIVSAKIKDAKFKRVEEGDARFKPVIFLHPMSNWHLRSDFKNGVNAGGDIRNVWMFGIIGVFVLLLACINFMNLSTARSEKRAKEVGIRKAVGSVRSQLIGQFFSESLVVSIGAFIISLVLAQLLLPFFNDVADKKIAIPWSSPLFWLAGIGFSILTGLIAGSYPALYLSSFNPVKVLKGTFRVGRFASIPRKALVVIQFTVSIILIVGTITVYRQIQFAKNRPVGYAKNGIVSLGMRNGEIRKHYDAFRNDMLNSGAVQAVALSESPITNTWVTNSGLTWEGKDPAMQEEFVTVGISHEFGKTIGWEIKDGRDFSKEFATDSTGFIINEAAVKYMAFKNPIGQTIKWGQNGSYKVIGVIKDLVSQNPYSPVKQMIFYLDYKRASFLDIRINPMMSVSESLHKISTVIKKYDPVSPLDYSFADQEYAKKFGNEERIGKLSSYFALLAILISCLGLFGLASFMAEQRTKEIGVRKVLGASVFSLWRLLSREFVVLVIISLLLASPVAYYFMNEWLQDYQYRIKLNWVIFGIAGIGALLITLFTVSFQSIKAALMNPVRSLRSE